ncbi:MAG: hypothetical protein R6X12_08035 [bacterium]
MKVRAVVWSLVGLVVVAGVVLLVATPNRTPQARIDIDGVRRQAGVVSGKLASLEEKLVFARGQLPPGQDPDTLAPVEQHLAEARSAVDEAGRLEDVDAAYEKLKAARKQLSLGTRKLNELTRPRRPGGV